MEQECNPSNKQLKQKTLESEDNWPTQHVPPASLVKQQDPIKQTPEHMGILYGYIIF